LSSKNSFKFLGSLEIRYRYDSGLLLQDFILPDNSLSSLSAVAAHTRGISFEWAMLI